MSVERVADISHDEFMTRFYEPGIPVVFTTAAKRWKARGLFTPDWFREHFGDRQLRRGETTYTMRQVMDLVESSTVERPAPYPLVYDVPSALPELLPLITPLNLTYAVPNWLERKPFSLGKWGGATQLFVGGPGGQFPYAHVDLYHLSAWITQLYGEKEFIVYPREQGHLLYPHPEHPWKSQVNIFNPDFEQHPLYREAKPLTFTVGPGETLFIPFGLWHSAYSLTTTISIAFDQLNAKNYPLFMRDVWFLKKQGGGALKAASMYGYAAVMGQVCRVADAVLPQITA